MMDESAVQRICGWPERINWRHAISPFVEKTSKLKAVDGQGGAEALLAVVDLHRGAVGSVDPKISQLST